MGRAIFISYRRDDSEGEAGRLFDDLVRTFGDASVFMDVAGISPGIDFRKAIDDNVATCGVLLAMIGPGWVTVAGGSGERRLDDPNDFVRLEIASALARNIPVIPVLVHDAKMPRPEQLPENLKDFAYRNSVEITHARWNSDVQLLTKALAQYISPASNTSTEPVHANVPVQLPAPNAPLREPAAAAPSKMPLIAGGALLALALGVGGFFLMRPHPAPTPDAAGAFVGWWGLSQRAVSSAGDELVQMQITGSGNQISAQGYGDCSPCDWGTQTAAIANNSATFTFDLASQHTAIAADSGRVAQVTVTPDGDKLDVVVHNTYTDRGPTGRKMQFARHTGPVDLQSPSPSPPASTPMPVPVPAPVSTKPTAPSCDAALENQCQAMVQDKVVWNLSSPANPGSRHWAPKNVQSLCACTTNPKQTVACFEGALANNGHPTTWPVALAACRAK